MKSYRSETGGGRKERRIAYSVWRMLGVLSHDTHLPRRGRTGVRRRSPTCGNLPTAFRIFSGVFDTRRRDFRWPAQDGLLELNRGNSSRNVDRDGCPRTAGIDFRRTTLPCSGCNCHRLGMFPARQGTLLLATTRGSNEYCVCGAFEYFRETFREELARGAFSSIRLGPMANARRLAIFLRSSGTKTAGSTVFLFKPRIIGRTRATPACSVGLRDGPHAIVPGLHRGVLASEVSFQKTPPPLPANVSAYRAQSAKSP